MEFQPQDWRDELVIVWMQMLEQHMHTVDSVDRLMAKAQDQSQELQALQTHVKTLGTLFEDAQNILRLSEPEQEPAKPASPTSVEAPAKPMEEPQDGVCGWTLNATNDCGAATHDMLMKRIRKMLKQPESAAPASDLHKRKASAGSSSAAMDAKHHRYAFSKSRLENFEAEKVLDVRGSRTSVRDYLVQWKGMAEPMWVTRRKCPEQARELINAFVKARRAQSRRQSRMLARGLLDPATVRSQTSNDIFIVDKIVDHKVRYGKKYYFVKWEGYTDDDNTWERADKLRQEVAEVVEQYEQQRARAKALARSSNDNQQHQSESEDDEAAEQPAKRLKRTDESAPKDPEEQEFDDESDMEFPFLPYEDQDLDNEINNAADELEEKVPVPAYSDDA